MSYMTVQEFAKKIVLEKPFRKEVVSHCYEVDPPEGDENGLGKWLNVGAEKMGYDFDPIELHKAIKVQLDKLGAFKKIAFMGSLINTANKARKAAGIGK